MKGSVNTRSAAQTQASPRVQGVAAHISARSQRLSGLRAPSRNCTTLPRPNLPTFAQKNPIVNFLDSEQAQAGAAAGADGKVSTTWKVDIFSTKASWNGPVKPVRLSLTVVGTDGVQYAQVLLDGTWTEEVWNQANNYAGSKHSGEVSLPAGVVPAAIVLEQKSLPAVDPKKTLISTVRFSNKTKPEDTSVEFACDGYLTRGPRTFFGGPALLPAQTQEGLRQRRQAELKALRGGDNPEVINAQRKGDERIYDYQVYNDLGDATKNVRPPLGGSTLPYPRRMRTGRANYVGPDGQPTKYEVAPDKGSAWVPADDDFDKEKQVGFVGNALLSLLPVIQLLKDGRKEFYNMQEVLSLFDNDEGKMEPALRRTKVSGMEQLIFNVRKAIVRALRKFKNEKSGRNLIDTIVDIFEPYNDITDIFEYPAPINIADPTRPNMANPEDKEFQKHVDLASLSQQPGAHSRVDTWRTDEEFGRQYLAGINPMVLVAMTQERGLPASSSITEANLTPMLEGHTFDELLASPKPRLFYVDYHTVIIDYVDRINVEYAKGDNTKVQHAGHCVLYLRDDGYLVPIAIDLTSNKGVAPSVYTYLDQGAVWPLAKAIFSSIDSGFHQLISHWLRTHACQEPYLIATRRCLSAMHPVHKLILPHFRYTMRINANARTSLINAGGVIESCFTPGKFSMALSASVYGAVWSFANEALPADLKLRGFLDESGKLNVEDYPYAEDGMLIWNAIEKYFTQYINLYYKSDAEVLADEEVQNWWTEIKTQGHMDKANDPTWPVLGTRANLVYVLATMAWMGSAHHAAVNFGQYDYAAFMPGHSSLIRKAMPQRGTEQFKMLSLADGSTGDFHMLEYLSTPTAAVQVTTVVKLLTMHSKDEQYLSDEKQEYLTDPTAKALHAQFVADIKAAETEIFQRNRDPARITRSIAAKGLPYRYLIASSSEGSTGQGIPYSISI